MQFTQIRNKKDNQTTIGSQTAKEQETVRQLSRGCLFLAITLIIIVAGVLYLCARH